MSRLPHRFWLALVSIAMSAPTALGQQQDQNQPEQPIPASHSPLAGLNTRPVTNSPVRDQQPAPDTQPLAGAQNLSLGVPPVTHSYWQPRADITGIFDSNPLSGNTSSGWAAYVTPL